MYRIFMVFGVLLLSLQAQELTMEEVMKVHQYNHKLSLKIRHQRVLQRLAHISKEKAHALAQEQCAGEVQQSRLKTHNRRLFYTVQTKSCSVDIDALDGSIITKEEA